MFVIQMNLFLLSSSKRKSARLHCNRHVVKMVLETTQLLWTAVHVGGIDVATLPIKAYRKTHAWHPTAIWVRETSKNWEFTVAFGLALCTEYTRRYGKHHKCEMHLQFLRRFGYVEPQERRPIKSKCGPLTNGCTPFPLAMPDECVVYKKGCPHAVKSYRKYYESKNKDWVEKGRPMVWDIKVPSPSRQDKVCVPL